MTADSSTSINWRGKRSRELDEGNSKISNEESNKLFHNLKKYFESKFGEVYKVNERLAKNIKTLPHQKLLALSGF